MARWFVHTPSHEVPKSETGRTSQFLRCFLLFYLPVELGDVVTGNNKHVFVIFMDIICNYCSEDAGTGNMELHNAE